MSGFRVRFAVGIMAISVAAVAAFVLYEEFGGYFGSARWRSGGKPEEITVVVHSKDGTPRKGIEVISTSDSGDSSPEYTSPSGIALINPNEDEVVALRVNGALLMNKNNCVEEWFAPKIGKDGLIFDVCLK